MKPICVPCRRFFRPKKNGVEFVEGMPIDNHAPAGLEAPHLWRPYKLWMADQWECRGCGASIIIGAGHAPIAEHFEPGFGERTRARGGDVLQINDC